MNAYTSRLLICALVLSLAPITPNTVQAQTPAPASAPATPATTAPQPEMLTATPADLEYATRVALAQGVMTLKKLAEKDPQGWIIPPVQRVSVTGYKDVPMKYRMVEVDRPIYEYTDVVVFIPGSSPGEPPIKQLRQQPTKQIGTRKESHIRWDPEGPLEMIYKQPIYEYIGDTSWQCSLVGDSAMALEALRAAGLSEGDPVVQHMVDNLFGYLDTYGPPDQTWNLAWLAIVMARTDGELATEWTEKLASRILDGQIIDGAARGLWGPMCVNPRLFAILMRDYLAGEAELAKRQAKAKEKPTKANKVLADEAEGTRNRLKKYADSWSHLALRFATVEFPLVWDDQMTEKVNFQGTTDFFYNQRSADMESTWIALHALSICAEMKRLPKESQRTSIAPSYGSIAKIGEKAKRPPAVASQMNAETVPPEPAIAVLARAANALATLLPEGKGWSECNFHQPVTDFDAFKQYLAVPANPESFPLLASPVTATSAAQGVAALDAIGRAVGMDKLAKFLPKYRAGAQARTTAMQELIKTLWPKTTQRPGQLRQDVLGLCLATTRPLEVNAPEVASAAPFTDQLARMLILAGDATGEWGARMSRAQITTSSRERYAVLKDRPGQNWRSWHLNSPVELHKAHVAEYNVVPTSYNTSPGAPFATAIAVHYLASRLKNPGATLQQLCADPALAEQRKGVDVLLIDKPKPKPVPVIAAKPAAVPAKGGVVKPTEETIPVIPLKPADTKPKKDESF